jgi:hypothetical protein
MLRRGVPGTPGCDKYPEQSTLKKYQLGVLYLGIEVGKWNTITNKLVTASVKDSNY